MKHVARSWLLRHCNGQLITVVVARQHTCLGSDSDPEEKCEQSERLLQVLMFLIPEIKYGVSDAGSLLHPANIYAVKWGGTNILDLTLARQSRASSLSAAQMNLHQSFYRVRNLTISLLMIR